MTKISFELLHQSLQQILLKFDDSLQQMDFRNLEEIVQYHLEEES